MIIFLVNSINVSEGKNSWKNLTRLQSSYTFHPSFGILCTISSFFYNIPSLTRKAKHIYNICLLLHSAGTIHFSTQSKSVPYTMQKLIKERGKKSEQLFIVKSALFWSTYIVKPESRHLKPYLVGLLKWPIFNVRASKTLLDKRN